MIKYNLEVISDYFFPKMYFNLMIPSHMSKRQKMAVISQKMADRSHSHRQLQAFDQTGSEEIFKPEIKQYIFEKFAKEFYS